MDGVKKMGEYKYKIEFELEQQTPMLHFQHDQKGATLRVSEVKPKLDKFLLKILGKGDYDEGKKIAKEKDEEISKEKNGKATWLVGNGEHPALNYKMQIVASGEPEISKDIKSFIKSKNFQSSIPKSFFGNMVDLSKVENVEDKKKLVKNYFKETVLYKSSNNPHIKITIICFNNRLLKRIEKCICSFFLIHNFGTRQNKGFGSFKIMNKNEKWDRLYMKYFYKKYYCINYNKEVKNENEMLNDINVIYGLMKSGFNFTKLKNKRNELVSPNDYYKGFIFQYMHNIYGNYNNSVDNDKAFMKSNILEEQKKNNENNENFRFVRALLGLNDIYKFKNVNVIVKCKNKNEDENKNKNKNEVDRFSSPILFKPHGNKLYIFPGNIHEEMFSHKFNFSKEDKKNINNKDLITPSKEEFNLTDFIDAFCEYYNEEDEIKKIKSDKNIRLLEECENNNIKKTIDKKLKIEKIKVGDEKNA